MSSFFKSCGTWLQHNLAWSNSRQSWQERGGLAVLLLGALLAVWLGSRWTLSAQVAVWAFLLVALAVLLRRGWFKLFGPVLFYDMLRVGRRSRYILFRFLYTVGLLLLLWWVHWMWSLEYSDVGGVPAQRMAQFAESFFFTFMSVQLILVLILTPAYVAGAIAEEKERKTLEFLLATDLRNREIVLSKLVARLANLTLIVLAGLPILSALQFLGGVDPDLLLASFALVGLTMMSLASVSILLSVRARKPRDAIVFSYLVILVYPTLALLTLGLHYYLLYQLRIGNVSPTLFTPVATAVGWLSEVLNSGNLVYVIALVIRTIEMGGNVADQLPDLVRDYALFHGLATLLCSGWAVLRLRAIALSENEVKKRKLNVGLIDRPRVSESPMLWKEIFAEPRMRLGWIGRSIIALLVFSSLIPVWYILTDDYGSRYRSYDYLSREMNVWVRVVGSIVCCLMLLAVAVRASGTVSSERDKQTLDALLTSPLDTRTILFGKWAGSVLSVRWGWLWIGGIWLLGLITGGLNPCAFPLLMAAWLVYASVFAVVGLWFSVVCKTTLRATVWALIATLTLAGGHWLIMGMCCFMPCGLLIRSDSGKSLEYAAKFEAGQTPPFVLGMLAFHTRDLEHTGSDEGELMFFSLIGVVSWGVGALVLFNATNARFQTLTGREPMTQRRPPRSVPRDGLPGPPDASGSDPFPPSA